MSTLAHCDAACLLPLGLFSNAKRVMPCLAGDYKTLELSAEGFGKELH